MRILRSLIVLVTLLLLTPCVSNAQFNKGYFFYLGREFLIDNRYSDAIEMLNVLIKADPKAHEAYFLRGVAKYNLDDLLGAESDFSKAIEINNVFTTAHQYRAITRSRLGNYDMALRDFAEAIDLRPDVAGPYFSRGVTYLLSKQLDKAIEDFNQFIRYEPRVADAYINRGICYLMQRDTTAAFDNFNMAIRTNRLSPDGYNRRGALYMSQQEYDKALNDFNHAIQNDSMNIPSYFSRALVYANTKRPTKAIEDFTKVLSIDSTNSLTYFNRAILRSQIGDYNKAMEDYDRVADLNPNNVLVFYNRAALQNELGQKQEAIEDYSQAINLYPDFANAYLGRSAIKYALGDTKGSKKDHDVAQKKIAEYRSKLTDSTFSIYADTSRVFNSLLSFDAEFGGGDLNNLAKNNKSVDITLLPLFRFTVSEQDTVIKANYYRYFNPRLDQFTSSFNNIKLTLSNSESSMDADKLMSISQGLDSLVDNGDNSWKTLMFKATVQSLMRRYTTAIQTFTKAIEVDSKNPFIYMNRSTTQSEMIDFISSIDNNYQKVIIDSDPVNKLRNSSTRVYNYDDAIKDLDLATIYFPDFAHLYYNRGNLKTLSGDLPAAIDDYNKAIELYPYFAEAYYNRGLVQIYLKDTKKGCLDISKAGELGIPQAYSVLKKYSEKKL